ncbi:MAG TPA: ABC transporter substrate-binding protein [Verrucomicrobiae bacterium]|nr:ABC transporter substrate-binding protein [Verrucomicrobiae bacterium]
MARKSQAGAGLSWAKIKMIHPGFRRKFIAAMVASNVLLWGCALFLWGCKKSGQIAAAPESGSGLTKIRVGYIGLTCEAPIYMAVEKGFFKEEGLDPVLVKCDWANYKDVMALGGFDITHHLVMYFLKPIEQGLDVKFTGGIHRGCLRVQAPPHGKVNTVEDLRGKRIGIPGMGTPPFIFANRALIAHGIDPSKEITWVVYPAGQLGLALDKGDVDAVADSEPIGTLLESEGKVKNIADEAKDSPYKDEYCCEVVVNGQFLRANPKAAAAATRALLKAAKWVQTNPAAAARLSVEKHYLASNPELNSVAISHLDYIPSVSLAETSVKTAAIAMKQDGMLSPSTDADDLAKRAFAHLDGVSDEWINSLQVEKVAGGQLPPDENQRLMAELSRGPANVTEYGDLSCCRLANTR